MDHWYEQILSTLMNSPYLPADNILIHGFEVLAKGRTLKRGSTLLKHSRFMRNLEVLPLLPVPGDPNEHHQMDMEGMEYDMDEDFEEMDEEQ